MDYIEEAHKLINKKQYNEALAIYTECLKKNPGKELNVLGHRAWLFRIMQNYEDAIKDYKLLLEIDPGNIEAIYLMAETFIFSGNPDLALKEIREIATENFDSTNTLKFLLQYHFCKSNNENLEDVLDAKIHPVSQWSINPVITLLEKYDSGYPGSCFPETSRFLYDFVRMVRPLNVIETGTFIGHSTICIAQALEHNNYGHLDSFDIFLDYHNYISPIMGACSDALKVAQTHIDKSGLSNRITLHKGDSSTLLRKMYHNLLNKVDLAFIDADHMISGAFKDWNVIDPLIKENGWIILHDIDPEKCHWLGPYEILKLLESKRSEYKFVKIPSPEGFGLGIIQKQSKSSGKNLRFRFVDLLRELLFNLIYRKNYSLDSVKIILRKLIS